VKDGVGGISAESNKFRASINFSKEGNSTTESGMTASLFPRRSKIFNEIRFRNDLVLLSPIAIVLTLSIYL